jgi:hypothetical protein
MSARFVATFDGAPAAAAADRAAAGASQGAPGPASATVLGRCMAARSLHAAAQTRVTTTTTACSAAAAAAPPRAHRSITFSTTTAPTLLPTRSCSAATSAPKTITSGVSCCARSSAIAPMITLSSAEDTWALLCPA